MGGACVARQNFFMRLKNTKLKGDKLIALLQVIEGDLNDANLSIYIAQREQNRQLFLQYSKVKKRLLHERKIIVGIMNYIIGEHDDAAEN